MLRQKKLLALLVLMAVAMSVMPLGAAFAQPAIDPLWKAEGLEDEGIIEQTNEEQTKASSPYYIYIEKGSYTMTVYGKDSSGNYTKRVKSYRVAIGRNNRTPSGKFSIQGKERWHTFSAGGHAQYASRYSGNLYIHSPLYGTRNIYDMWTNYYYAIGTAATAGCIRTHCAAAYWVYANCPAGTTVEIVSGSPKGTSSPGAPALNASNKKYDPTDPGVKQTGSTGGTGTSTGSTAPSIQWKQSGGKWYLYSGGKMQTGWQKVSLEWYYLGSDGAMRTGWQKISDKWYYFKTGGQMAIYWHKVGNDWYYFGSDGAMKTGWQKEDGKWYYMESSGRMLHSQVLEASGKGYLLNANGMMVANKWEKTNGKWYYANANGELAKGWKKSGGKWYFLGEDYAMATGFVTVGDAKYYMDAAGAMITGWKSVDGKWYYFDDSGAMQANKWADLGGKRYYFNAEGHMVTGQVTIDGVLHNFGEDGVYIGQVEADAQQ